MKSILSLIMVDLKLVLKNIFFWVLIGMLVAIIFTVNFLLPKEITPKSPDFVTYGFEMSGYRQVDTIDRIKELVAQDENIVGVALDKGLCKQFQQKASRRCDPAIYSADGRSNTGTGFPDREHH